MMRSLTHYAVSLALALGAASSSIAQTTSTQKKPAGSVVSGKVTIKGKAAPGVVVGLRPSQPTTPFEPTYKATSDQEGKYRITDVLAGSYLVAAQAPAFVVSDMINSRGQTVVLADGENVEGIDFALVRGGVITGRVTDADGRPVVEQRVNLISAELQTNTRQPVNSFSGVQTDDRGIYRMFGLPAGRYKVSVGLTTDGFFVAGFANQSYKQTFHPDVTDVAKAAIVEVTEGSEAANVDISVGRANQTFTASGRIIDGETSKPIMNIRFGLQMITDSQHRSYVGTTAVSNSRGEFKVEGLAPGKYAIYVQGQPDSELRADAVNFDVLDQDVTDLVIKSAPGMTVSGTIVLENTDDKVVLAKLLHLTIRGFVQSAGAAGNMSHAATINGDGSFLMKGLEPGMLFVSLGAPGDVSQLKGFNITRTERDGVIQPRGVEIKTGEQVSGVKVMVSYGNATIHGVVKFENGSPPADARMFVRIGKPGDNGIPNIRPPQVDSRGHFIVEGLPGGTYEFVVSVMGVPGTRPIFAKQQVNVADGIVNDVTITVDLGQKPGPPAP